MSTELEFEGKDISEAVEKACFAHQVTEAELEYEVIRHESKKLFGFIGGKSALITPGRGLTSNVSTPTISPGSLATHSLGFLMA